MDDIQAPPIGTLGTVLAVDDTGSLIMQWDNGSSLNIIYGVDKVKIVEKDNKLKKLMCNKSPTISEVFMNKNNKTETNEKGEYINCIFYKGKNCAALKVWYHEEPGAHCSSCPFFKPAESDT